MWSGRSSGRWRMARGSHRSGWGCGADPQAGYFGPRDAATLDVPEYLPQCRLVHLARRIARQRVGKHHGVRQLIASETRGTVRHHLILGQRLARLHDNDRTPDLTPSRIGNSDHGSFGDSLMLVKNIFDLRRIDI